MCEQLVQREFFTTLPSGFHEVLVSNGRGHQDFLDVSNELNHSRPLAGVENIMS